MLYKFEAAFRNIRKVRISEKPITIKYLSRSYNICLLYIYTCNIGIYLIKFTFRAIKSLYANVAYGL